MDLLIYDGTFGGLLTTVFEIYEYKVRFPIVKREGYADGYLFGEPRIVITDACKARRVFVKLQSLLTSSALLKLKYAFLSEEREVENNLVGYIRLAIDSKMNIEKNYADKYVVAVENASRKTGREAHRMKGFVRFRLSADNLYFSTIEPDHDVLPVIIKHFKDRFASQKWLIYDLKRKYGIYYDLENIVEVNVETNIDNNNEIAGMALHEDEAPYQKLWKQYFKTTTIAARKNTKLHIQHLPKRYWKHLTEKIIL